MKRQGREKEEKRKPSSAPGEKGNRRELRPDHGEKVDLKIIEREGKGNMVKRSDTARVDDSNRTFGRAT